VLPEYVVVGASKAAIESITRNLAVELAPMNIIVNAVSPGIVLTEALQHFEMVRTDAHLAERAVGITPAGRLVNPQDIAEVVAFLCSPARMIRGQVIVVDGGASLLAPGLEMPTQT
jgi:enoyl-[acyl-carrier protein] reductase III